MQGEEKAILVLQCAVRCGAARRVLRREREWREEDQRWRQALRRRRQRIERLERELRHVENLPALDVDRYAATARYGIKGAVAAVQTIQGFWRARQRRRRRLQKEQERRDRAARALQKFFKKYPKLRKKRLRDNLKSKEATPKKRGSIGDRARDETPWELPSVQIVRSLQAKVTAHLEAWRSAGGLDRPRVAEELEDQAQRAKSRFAEFQTALASSRKESLARSQLRQDAAACYLALRNCHGLEQLENDAELEACAKGQRYVAGIHDKEYAALVEDAALHEHGQLLSAFAGVRKAK